MFEEKEENKESKEVIKNKPGRKKAVGPNDDLTVKIELTNDEKENKQESKGRKEVYTVKGKERNYIHVELENVMYSGPKKTSVPYVQIYEPNMWHNVIRKQIKSSGFSHVRILHAPDGVNTDMTSKK